MPGRARGPRRHPGIDLRDIVARDGAEADALLRDDEDFAVSGGGLADIDIARYPLRLRVRRGAAERERKTLSADGAAGEVHRDDAMAGFVRLGPLAERVAAERLEIEAVGQREAEAEDAGAVISTFISTAITRRSLRERERLPGGDAHFRRDGCDLEGDAAAGAAVAVCLLEHGNRLLIQRRGMRSSKSSRLIAERPSAARLPAAHPRQSEADGADLARGTGDVHRLQADLRGQRGDAELGLHVEVERIRLRGESETRSLRAWGSNRQRPTGRSSHRHGEAGGHVELQRGHAALRGADRDAVEAIHHAGAGM